MVMAAPRSLSEKSIGEALRHVSRVDKRVASLADVHGPPKGLVSKRRAEDAFQALTRAVVSQQLAVKAAAAIHARFVELCDGDVKPEAVLALEFDELRNVGLSGSKATYIQNVARRFAPEGAVEESENASSTDRRLTDALCNQLTDEELHKVNALSHTHVHVHIHMYTGGNRVNRHLQVLPISLTSRREEMYVCSYRSSRQSKGSGNGQYICFRCFTSEGQTYCRSATSVCERACRRSISSRNCPVGRKWSRLPKSGVLIAQWVHSICGEAKSRRKRTMRMTQRQWQWRRQTREVRMRRRNE